MIKKWQALIFSAFLLSSCFNGQVIAWGMKGWLSNKTESRREAERQDLSQFHECHQCNVGDYIVRECFDKQENLHTCSAHKTTPYLLEKNCQNLGIGWNSGNCFKQKNSTAQAR